MLHEKEIHDIDHTARLEQEKKQVQAAKDAASLVLILVRAELRAARALDETPGGPEHALRLEALEELCAELSWRAQHGRKP